MPNITILNVCLARFILWASINTFSSVLYNSSQILADSLLDFVKDTADMPTNSDESKLPPTLVLNLFIY